MPPRLQAANNASSTLNGGIDSVVAALLLVSSATFPVAPFRITIDSEVIEVGTINVATHVLSVLLRGQEGTVAASHLSGAAVECRFTKGMYEELSGEQAPTELINGTAALPAFTFSSDPDTGVFRKGVNDLGFAAGGVEKMHMDASGPQVGTDPLATVGMLPVVKDSPSSGPIFNPGGWSSTVYGSWADTTVYTTGGVVMASIHPAAPGAICARLTIDNGVTYTYSTTALRGVLHLPLFRFLNHFTIGVKISAGGGASWAVNYTVWATNTTP